MPSDTNDSLSNLLENLGQSVAVDIIRGLCGRFNDANRNHAVMPGRLILLGDEAVFNHSGTCGGGPRNIEILVDSALRSSREFQVVLDSLIPEQIPEELSRFCKPTFDFRDVGLFTWPIRATLVMTDSSLEATAQREDRPWTSSVILRSRRDDQDLLHFGAVIDWVAQNAVRLDVQSSYIAPLLSVPKPSHLLITEVMNGIRDAKCEKTHISNLPERSRMGNIATLLQLGAGEELRMEVSSWVEDATLQSRFRRVNLLTSIADMFSRFSEIYLSPPADYDHNNGVNQRQRTGNVVELFPRSRPASYVVSQEVVQIRDFLIEALDRVEAAQREVRTRNQQEFGFGLLGI